jgi:hypothetical protein
MSLAERIAQEFNTVRGEITESDSTAVKLTGSQTIEGVKTFTSSIQGNLVGNSATAIKLATPRKITLSGDVSGNVSFDGSTDVTLSAEVANDSHVHSTSTITGLGTASTRDVGTGAGNVMEVGAFGLGRKNTDFMNTDLEISDFSIQTTVGFYAVDNDPLDAPTNWNGGSKGSLIVAVEGGAGNRVNQFATQGYPTIRTWFRGQNIDYTWNSWEEIHHTGNIFQTTGTSTDYPMSQKATTDAINTVVNRSSKQIGEPFPIFTNITGVTEPDNSGSMKFIRLTAGLTGAGKYNNGLLQNETVSGSWPYITATAVISVGPLAGQTIRLINYEGRYLRPATTSGTMQESQNKEHTHIGSTTTNGTHTHTYTKTDAQLSFYHTATQAYTQVTQSTQNTSWSGNHAHSLIIANQGGDEARPRTITATYYMRIV